MNATQSFAFDEDEDISNSVIFRLQLVREARLLFGPERARVLWRSLELPAVPPAPATGLHEARICIRHLLDAPIHGSGQPIREVLEAALDEDESARVMLVSVGIRVYADRDAFLVMSSVAPVDQIFAGTEWDGGRYARVLRRLPGVAGANTPRSGRKGVLIPADYLDDEFQATEGVAVTAL